MTAQHAREHRPITIHTIMPGGPNRLAIDFVQYECGCFRIRGYSINRVDGWIARILSEKDTIA